MSSDLLDYDLPPHLIAQEPAADRDASRLLVVDRSSRRLSHHHFRDLPDLLNPGDLIVLNDTRVLPARLVGKREKTGGKWEGLFLRETSDGLWELLAQTRGHPVAGEVIAIDPGPLTLTLRGRSNGHWLAEPSPPGRPAELLAVSGQVPLPPYIRKGRRTASATRPSTPAPTARSPPRRPGCTSPRPCSTACGPAESAGPTSPCTSAWARSSQ
jgi:S-adenosylmethionine:tRNA ribosyltransferase-isomerase